MTEQPIHLGKGNNPRSKQGGGGSEKLCVLHYNHNKSDIHIKPSTLQRYMKLLQYDVLQMIQKYNYKTFARKYHLILINPYMVYIGGAIKHLQHIQSWLEKKTITTTR